VIVAVHPQECSDALADGLALAGVTAVEVPELDADDRRIQEARVIVVELGDQPMRRIRGVSGLAEELGIPVIVVATSDQMVLLESASAITDFLVHPLDPIELRLRLLRTITPESGDETISFKDLTLNPLTYQATLGGEPLDLTYVEYELLRFLMENPVRVWSREQLLSRVWGYDYYGGARTVDVHVRRLRSKLGEERARWIATVRSVGYRFG
jgi:DNA-binding response OmpR family regulator